MSTYKFKTTKIKGKDYVEVNERIKFFRQETQYDGWAIETEFPLLTEDEALCRCTISNAEGITVAAGHAHERRDMGMINKTSYVENCETSAVGRALAILGIGQTLGSYIFFGLRLGVTLCHVQFQQGGYEYNQHLLTSLTFFFPQGARVLSILLTYLLTYLEKNVCTFFSLTTKALVPPRDEGTPLHMLLSLSER